MNADLVSLHTILATASVTRRRALAAAIGVAGGLALRRSATARDVAGDASLDAVDVVATAEPGQRALDAAPSPDGSIVYFTATGPGGPGVYRVTADLAVETVHAGPPLVAPRGLVVSADGVTLYIADLAAPSGAAGGQGGRLFAVPAAGGNPTAIPGSDGLSPRALDLLAADRVERLIVAGIDPATGIPALMSLGLASSSGAAVIAAGAPLIAPGGVAVAADGAIYVADRGPAGVETGGRVYRLGDGTLDPIAEDVRCGDPAGIALIAGDTLLAVSALDPDAGTARVLLIDLATGQTAIATKGIGANRGAGGLHRARDAEVLAWIDSEGGNVYRITTRPRG